MRAVGLLTLLMTFLTLAAYSAGQRIKSDVLAYLSTQGDVNTLKIMDTGRGITSSILTSGLSFNNLTWSNDGRLAFAVVDGINNEVYVWDGESVMNISNHPAYDDNAAWSPDGQLAFVSDRDGNYEIYVWDGTAAVNIFNNSTDRASPAWSSDGRLAFLSEHDGNDEIYVWDGKSAVNLTHSPDQERSAAWRP